MYGFLNGKTTKCQYVFNNRPYGPYVFVSRYFRGRAYILKQMLYLTDWPRMHTSRSTKQKIFRILKVKISVFQIFTFQQLTSKM